MSRRVFGREFKEAAVRRMLAGANVSALARELGVRRKLLYEWRAALSGGRARGRPPEPPSGALTQARRRIAELERTVGRQQMELDFFRRALRRVEASGRPGGAGATASTPSSRR